MARELASRNAETLPGRAAGNTIWRMVSALVVPAAREPSRRDCGTAVPGLAIAYRQQRIGNLLGHRKLEAERRIDMGRGNALHPLQSLDAALGLTGLRGLGLEPVDEPLDFGDPGLLAFKTGLLLGQTLQTTPCEIYRALIECTAFGALTIIKRFEEHDLEVRRVVNCGGIADKSPLVMLIYADVLRSDMPVSRSLQNCTPGSAFAAAVVAG